MKLTKSEADALIAEKIFGWSWRTAYGRCYLIPQYLVDSLAWNSSWTLGRLEGKECPIEHAFQDYKHAAIPQFSSDGKGARDLRSKLGETWSTNLGHASDKFAFALWPKGTEGNEIPPTHIGAGSTEELAGVVCALKTVGIDAEIAD